MPSSVAQTYTPPPSVRSLMPWAVRINYALAEARHIAFCILWPLILVALGSVIICIFDDIQATWAMIPYCIGWMIWLYGICSFGVPSATKELQL